MSEEPDRRREVDTEKLLGFAAEIKQAPDVAVFNNEMIYETRAAARADGEAYQRGLEGLDVHVDVETAARGGRRRQG